MSATRHPTLKPDEVSSFRVDGPNMESINWRRRAAASPVAIMYRGSGEVILSILLLSTV